jgi:hypothetical protein
MLAVLTLSRFVAELSFNCALNVESPVRYKLISPVYSATTRLNLGQIVDFLLISPAYAGIASNKSRYTHLSIRGLIAEL